MNSVGPGLLDAVGLDSLQTAIRSLVTDPQVSVSATVKTLSTATTIDTASGIITRTTVDDTVTAYLAPLTSRDVDEGGLYEVGDHRLLVSGEAAVLNATPDTSSTVTIASAEWLVIEVDYDSIGAVWHFVLRRSS